MRFLITVTAAVLFSVPVALPARQAPAPAPAIPTPESVLGFQPGADYRLANYEQVLAYFQKVDAASDHERHIEPQRRNRRRRDRVRRVCVHDVDAALDDRSAQGPRGAQVELGRRGARDDVQTVLASACGERLILARGDDRPVTAARELARKPQGLAFTATPSSLCVDMQHVQRHGAQLPWFVNRTQALVES